VEGAPKPIETAAYLAFVDRVVRAEPLSPEDAKKHPDVANLVLRCQMHKCTPGCKPPAASAAAKTARQRAVEQRAMEREPPDPPRRREEGVPCSDCCPLEPILDPDGVTYTPMSRQEVNDLTRKRMMCRHGAPWPRCHATHFRTPEESHLILPGDRDIILCRRTPESQRCNPYNLELLKLWQANMVRSHSSAPRPGSAAIYHPTRTSNL